MRPKLTLWKKRKFVRLRSLEQLIKRCPRNTGVTAAGGRFGSSSHSQLGSGATTTASSLISGLFRSAADSASDWFNPVQQRLTVGRPAGKMFPPTQQRPAESQMSEAAMRARQSPALSLFNRLDGLVLQLEGTREFFAEWPQQLCQRIRARANQGGPVTGYESSHHSMLTRRPNSTLATTTECWNGRDFSGYNKPLAPFGQPISSGHPEVAVSGAQPISPMVLNLVAQFKEIGTQLARKSMRSTLNPYDLMSLSTKIAEVAAASAAAAAAGTKTKSSPGEPLAEARVSEQQGQFVAGTASAAVARAAAQSMNVGGPADTEAAASMLVQTLSAPAGSAASDDLEAPDGEVAESDGADQDPDEPSESDERDDDAEQLDAQDSDNDEPDPECATEDCSDLLMASPTVTNGNGNSNGPPDFASTSGTTSTYSHDHANNNVHNGQGPSNSLEADPQHNEHHINNHVLNNHQHHHQHNSNNNNNNNHRHHQHHQHADPNTPVLNGDPGTGTTRFQVPVFTVGEGGPDQQQPVTNMEDSYVQTYNTLNGYIERQVSSSSPASSPFATGNVLLHSSGWLKLLASQLIALLLLAPFYRNHLGHQ